MSKFQFGKTKVQKTAESIRDDKEQGSAPLVPVTPDTNQQQNTPADEEVEEQKMETITDESAKEQEVSEQPAKELEPEAPQQPKEEPQQTQAPSGAADTAPVTNKALAAIKDKGTTNGIVVNVPMEDYFQLMMLKKIEKKTLKELALQAIHEFVERNRVM